MALSTNAIAGLVLMVGLAGSHLVAYQAGNTHGVNALRVSQQTETIRRLNERVTANSALADQYRQQAERENQNHEQELADIRAAAARSAGRRVYIDPAKVCGIAQSTEATTPGSPGSADSGAAVLSDAFAGDLRQLAADADEVTAAYRTLRVRAAACFE